MVYKLGQKVGNSRSQCLSFSSWWDVIVFSGFGSVLVLKETAKPSHMPSPEATLCTVKLGALKGMGNF